jgi:hypothetical protein
MQTLSHCLRWLAAMPQLTQGAAWRTAGAAPNRPRSLRQLPCLLTGHFGLHVIFRSSFMNARKILISSMVAASVVGVIGLAYAQTPPSPTSPSTSPGMQETNPPLPATQPNTMQQNNSGSMNAPATGSPRDGTMSDTPGTMRDGGAGMSTDSAAMGTERAARNDRN